MKTKWIRTALAMPANVVRGYLALSLAFVMMGWSTPSSAQKSWDTQAEWATGTANGTTWTRVVGDLQLTARPTQQQRTLYLYVTNKNSDDLVQIDPTTGAIRWRFNFAQAGFPNAGPSRVVVDTNDNVWVGLRSRSEVVQIDPQGRLLGAVTVGRSPRALTIDGQGFLWAGGHSTQYVVKINTTTRQIIARVNGFSCPYGAATDVNGDVWILNRCPGASGTLVTHINKVTIDNNAIAGTFQAPGGYGIAASQHGLIWVSSFEQSCIYRFNQIGRNLGCTPLQGRGRCVAIDSNGNAWVAGSHNINVAPNTNGQSTIRYVAKVGPNGVLRGSYTNVGEQSVGIAISKSGQNEAVWVFSYKESKLYKLQTSGTLTSIHNSGGLNPYAYSGMTGFGNAVVIQPADGTWNVVHNANIPSVFQHVNWTAQQPAGTTIQVRARTALTNQALRRATWGPWVNRGESLQVPGGIWIELSIKLTTTDSRITPSIDEATLAYIPSPDGAGLTGAGNATNGPNSNVQLGCAAVSPRHTGLFLGLFLLTFLCLLQLKRRRS